MQREAGDTWNNGVNRVFSAIEVSIPEIVKYSYQKVLSVSTSFIQNAPSSVNTVANELIGNKQ